MNRFASLARRPHAWPAATHALRPLCALLAALPLASLAQEATMPAVTVRATPAAAPATLPEQPTPEALAAGRAGVSRVVMPSDRDGPPSMTTRSPGRTPSDT